MPRLLPHLVLVLFVFYEPVLAIDLSPAARLGERTAEVAVRDKLGVVCRAKACSTWSARPRGGETRDGSARFNLLIFPQAADELVLSRKARAGCSLAASKSPRLGRTSRGGKSRGENGR